MQKIKTHLRGTFAIMQANEWNAKNENKVKENMQKIPKLNYLIGFFILLDDDKTLKSKFSLHKVKKNEIIES